MLATIPIDLIENGQRLRDISEAQVEALVNSIGDVGLLNPITVYRRELYRSGNQVDGYGLVAGLHRKTACERLGLVEIEANILDLDDLNRQIAECDENLCAPQLSPSDRARFTKRRKEAYEALHPETKHGANQHTRGDAKFASPSFADDQAAATGASKRTVQLDAERGEKVDDRALSLIKNTKLDTGKYLDTLKALPVSEQIKRAKADLAKPAPVRKNKARVADRPLDDAAALENQVAALVTAWNKASAEAREEFIRRVDLAPYFDPAIRAPHGEAAADSVPATVLNDQVSEAGEGDDLSPAIESIAKATKGKTAKVDGNHPETEKADADRVASRLSEGSGSLVASGGDMGEVPAPDAPIPTEAERIAGKYVSSLQRAADDASADLAKVKASFNPSTHFKNAAGIPRLHGCQDPDTCAGSWRELCHGCRRVAEARVA